MHFRHLGVHIVLLCQHSTELCLSNASHPNRRDGKRGINPSEKLGLELGVQVSTDFHDTQSYTDSDNQSVFIVILGMNLNNIRCIILYVSILFNCKWDTHGPCHTIAYSYISRGAYDSHGSIGCVNSYTDLAFLEIAGQGFGCSSSKPIFISVKCWLPAFNTAL